jgi:flagellar biosynthetic protein FlhB
MRKLRMSKQEIRQEMKDAEGDPHVRARMRSMRMSMTRNRMLNSIAGADVVITNPTHIAIAISYSREQGAPRVVARGAGALAEKIRAEADRHDVPRVESKPLARTLYRLCRPGEEIPAELYQAVATVLAFLHRLGESRRSFAGRLHLDVADSWTPSDGTELERVPPRARARARRQLAAAIAPRPT